MSKGFTLIEMITVLTIIIIVLAIAIPIWDAMMNGTNLSAAQNQISAFISNARADAIYNRQTIGVFFYIDSKTNQTAMAEVQVQTLYQQNPYSGPFPAYTYTFQPGYWTSPWTSWANWAKGVDNGAVDSLELVNSVSPTQPPPTTPPTPPIFNFYRDTVLLPKGVGIALNNSTYYYNMNNLWDNLNPPASPPGLTAVPPLDRYFHLGCIMFNPDGTLATIPFAIPYYDAMSALQYTNAQNTQTPTENLLCQHIGMYANTLGNLPDLASNVIYTPAAGTTPAHLPLVSSVGLVIYDRDVYLNQHAGPVTVMDNSNPAMPTQKQIGSGNPFSDMDMNYNLTPRDSADSAFETLPAPPYTSAPPLPNVSQAADKYLEESWIDQNGTAFLVSPFNGSLIKAK